MSDWLLWAAQCVIRGTFRSTAFTIDGVFTVLGTIVGRKVGEFVLPVATIDELRSFGGEQARNIILDKRLPTLEELQASYPGKEDVENYRVISVNPRDYQGATLRTPGVN